MSRHPWSELADGDAVFVKRVGDKLSIAVTVAGKTERVNLPCRDVKHSIHDAVLFQIRTLLQRLRTKVTDLAL